MNIKSDFTDEEWFLLSSTPAMVGAAMSSAAPSGVVGTIKEMTASMRASVQGLSDYPDSELITALLQRAENWDDAKEKMEDYREKAKARLETADIQSKQDLHAHIIADCEKAAQLVDAKCSANEAQMFREWTIKVANKVAEAAKEGGILGFGGERVSPEETEMLRKIESALGVQSGVLQA